MRHRIGIPAIYNSDRPVDGFSLYGFGGDFRISETLRHLRSVLEGLSEQTEAAAVALKDQEPHTDQMVTPVSLYGHTMIFDVAAEEAEAGLYRFELKLTGPSGAS